MITLRDATVSFEGSSRPALDRVSWGVRPGSWTAIVGANGSGKSTLLSALAGLVPLRAGVLERAGVPRVALLQQDADNQLVATRVRHELALSIPSDTSPDERRARLETAVARFDLAHLLDRNPHRLSGGEKQRLACATVWLEQPDVLLLDEPLAFLDADARARVIAFVRETHARGAAVVWATPGDDRSLAGEVVVLDQGRIVPGSIAAAAAPAPMPTMHARVANPARSGPVLTIEGASFAYEKRVVLESIDLAVAGGECVGVTGRNSAGKSTLLTLAGGAHKLASGRVARSLGEGGALYLPQTPERMFFAETVHEEIAFGVKRRRRKRGVEAPDLDSLIRASVEATGLDPSEVIPRSPFDLSFGEMRRVAFAIAYAMMPDLLLLDEPASCLDRAGRDVLAALVRSRTEAGAAVVIASHDRAHLDGVCDRVLELENGRLRSL